MVISEFTKPELDYFRDNCNFVGDEVYLFEARSKGISLEQIAEDLNMAPSSARALSCKVNKKINKIHTYQALSLH